MKKEKTILPMEKLTAGYEQFIKGKELNQGGKKAFDKTIKKAAKPTKQRGVK